MTENINFIPANKLPYADGKQVEVLCLEDGELKRKTADGLGSSGITVHYTVTELPQEEWMDYSVSPVPVGTFAKVKASLMGENYCPIEAVLHIICNDGGTITMANQRSINFAASWTPLPDGFPVDDAVVIALESDEYGDGGVINIILLSDDRILTQHQFEEEFGG